MLPPCRTVKVCAEDSVQFTSGAKGIRTECKQHIMYHRYVFQTSAPYKKDEIIQSQQHNTGKEIVKVPVPVRDKKWRNSRINYVNNYACPMLASTRFCSGREESNNCNQLVQVLYSLLRCLYSLFVTSPVWLLTNLGWLRNASVLTICCNIRQSNA